MLHGDKGVGWSAMPGSCDHSGAGFRTLLGAFHSFTNIPRDSCSPTNRPGEAKAASSKRLDEDGDIKKRDTEDRKRVGRKQDEFGFLLF